ncbi:hypothetical protein GWI33_012608 [Rhynchophorus ferrugineus]|uniref:Uncharacterized protein n=1 Tax=Rhynchophorus ferrugineus TaxID=354439 RepID=A0A834M7E5_RHYFE|nr:hypothetical protein GWI33_012608 [Rhynchophorus ferrugineus]
MATTKYSRLPRPLTHAPFTPPDHQPHPPPRRRNIQSCRTKHREQKGGDKGRVSPRAPWSRAQTIDLGRMRARSHRTRGAPIAFGAPAGTPVPCGPPPHF